MKTPRRRSPFLGRSAQSALTVSWVFFAAAWSPLSSADPLPVSIPAPVVTVLQNECILCHSEISNDFGRLDMSQWVDTPDGQQGFAHLGADGKQLPSRVTFREVLDRITTTDKDKHMPLGYTLKPEEDAPLRAWLEAKIKP